MTGSRVALKKETKTRRGNEEGREGEEGKQESLPVNSPAFLLPPLLSSRHPTPRLLTNFLSLARPPPSSSIAIILWQLRPHFPLLPPRRWFVFSQDRAARRSPERHLLRWARPASGSSLPVPPSPQSPSPLRGLPRTTLLFLAPHLIASLTDSCEKEKKRRGGRKEKRREQY